MSDAPPTPATEGAKITIQGTELTVAPKCEANNGFWICVTHDETFVHNFAKDSHLSAQPEGAICEFAWGCFEHGPEVP